MAQYCVSSSISFTVFIANKLAHKKVLIVFRFVVLQLPLFGLQTCSFCLKLQGLYYMSANRKALMSLRLCTDSSEPLLVAYVISTLFSCACSNIQTPQLLTILVLKFESAHFTTCCMSKNCWMSGKQCRP